MSRRVFASLDVSGESDLPLKKKKKISAIMNNVEKAAWCGDL